MKLYKLLVTMWFAFSLVASGCITTPEEEEVLAVEQAYEYYNNDDPVFFWNSSTQTYLGTMAQSRLVQANGEMTDTPLLSTTQGRRLLHYVIGCSAPTGTTVHSTLYGVSFDGAVGLAPEWISGPLNSTASQRWVTACLLQTLNALGVEVPILMKGSHSALADDPNADLSSYSVEDATMFGNVFVPGLIKGYVCVDEVVQLACGLGVSTYTLQRLCDSPLLCGVTFLGTCNLVCNYDQNGNPTCNNLLGGTYPESISTKLQQDGFSLLYPQCD